MSPFLLSILVTAFILDVAVSDGAQRRSHCSDTLPASLEKHIKERYPDWHVLSKKQYKLGCPGIVKVDFYGDGRTVYAIVIKTYRGHGGMVDGKLLMAQKKDVNWELTTLDEGEYAGMVWHEPAGEYTSVYKDRNLVSKGDVIIYFQPESWAVVYAWTGEKVDKIQLTD